MCVGIGIYAGVLESVMDPTDRDLSEPTLDTVHAELHQGGVVSPERLSAGHRAGPRGYELNVTLVTGGQSWTVGPSVPPAADTDRRTVSIRTAPGRVEPGRLQVAVW